MTKQEYEHFTHMYQVDTPEQSKFYICAVCKNYVHRLQNMPSRICCERRGCIDIDLRVCNYIILSSIVDRLSPGGRDEHGDEGASRS